MGTIVGVSCILLTGNAIINMDVYTYLLKIAWQ